MFLSLPTGAWVLIAVGATLVNLVAMQWIVQIPKYRRKQFWLPAIGIIGVGVRGLAQSHTLAETLYLYAAVMIMFPMMLAPVRRQITRDYYRWVEDPATKVGGGAMTWIATSMIFMLLAIGAVWAVGIGSASA
ncbi:hypothetical protein [Actinomadura algeriensis]|uniref:Uncharacterized protein n=1 Tax=Actinomadura algeriensis TaxID=1679523 RepID=A0ABR9JSD1_9ACTN|nr:hypothetical protein [Actinomadura algeriensis]MBE1533467.1 hypothetical protein [Actinomadura algeriensis]